MISSSQALSSSQAFSQTLRRFFLVTSLALAAVLLVPLTASAQGDGEGDVMGDRNRAEQIVTRILQLDEVQVEQWGDIRAAAAAAVEPLVAEVDSLQAQLEEVLAADNPDPTEVGTLLLAIRDLRQQIRAIGQAATDEFEALLNEEQAQRLQAVRRAARLQRVLPAFRAFRLLGDA